MDTATTSVTKRNRTPSNKAETAAAKFQRLALPRMEVALKKISLVGNLAGPGYDYEKDEAKQIIDALQEAVEEVAKKFSRSKTGKSGGGFSFRKRS